MNPYSDPTFIHAEMDWRYSHDLQHAHAARKHHRAGTRPSAFRAFLHSFSRRTEAASR
ncbi:MAG: hypothetical protein LWW86_04450 [Micrococcales bacterium]|nr:hypothetical protein [Micrococcales bacterium]